MSEALLRCTVIAESLRKIERRLIDIATTNADQLPTDPIARNELLRLRVELVSIASAVACVAEVAEALPAECPICGRTEDHTHGYGNDGHGARRS